MKALSSETRAAHQIDEEAGERRQDEHRHAEQEQDAELREQPQGDGDGRVIGPVRAAEGRGQPGRKVAGGKLSRGQRLPHRLREREPGQPFRLQDRVGRLEVHDQHKDRQAEPVADVAVADFAGASGTAGFQKGRIGTARVVGVENRSPFRRQRCRAVASK